MKSESEIKIDFAQAKKCAKELEDIAAEMKSLSNRDMEDSLQNLFGAWTGEAATAYINKGVKLQQKITANAANLERIAATIRSTAKRIYDAEMRALEIARERTYSKGN
jgi:WXG100 family type VII secretion target